MLQQRNDYHFFGKTKNDFPVYINPLHSHATSHFASNPKLEAAVRHALTEIEVDGDNIQLDFDTTQTIGYSDLVSVKDGDEIIYAKRQGRKVYTPFVKHKDPVLTSKVTLVLQKVTGGYLLLSAWVGPSVPPPPGDRREWPNSRVFWQTHALVLGRQAIDQSTITEVCPWK